MIKRNAPKRTWMPSKISKPPKISRPAATPINSDANGKALSRKNWNHSPPKAIACRSQRALVKTCSVPDQSNILWIPDEIKIRLRQSLPKNAIIACKKFIPSSPSTVLTKINDTPQSIFLQRSNLIPKQSSLKGVLFSSIMHRQTIYPD